MVTVRTGAELDKMRRACSGILDRLEQFTPEQRAAVFYLLECNWCWDCGVDQIDHGRTCEGDE